MLGVVGLVLAGLVVAAARSARSGPPNPVAATPTPSSSTTQAPLLHIDYSFRDTRSDGTPVRWNACAPIEYAVNLRNSPPGGLDDVQQAIARVSAATGLAFRSDGTTLTDPGDQIARGGLVYSADRMYAPVLISWVGHRRFSALEGDRETHALAFADPIEGFGQDAGYFVSGVVVVDESTVVSTGFRGRFSEGPILLHELGHIMGLAHVPSGDELMWSPHIPGYDKHPDPFLTDYGPGDLQGLKEVGRGDATCPSSSPSPSS